MLRGLVGRGERAPTSGFSEASPATSLGEGCQDGGSGVRYMYSGRQTSLAHQHGG